MVITNFIAKIVKILYIGNIIDVKPMQTLGIILSSWRYALIMLPVCIVAYVLLPDTLGGNIAIAGVFAAITIIVFLFMPQFVGKQYQKEVYEKVVSFIKQKFRYLLHSII